MDIQDEGAGEDCRGREKSSSSRSSSTWEWSRGIGVGYEAYFVDFHLRILCWVNFIGKWGDFGKFFFFSGCFTLPV